MVKVNGKMLDTAGKNLLELLEDMKCSGGRVAVELNGDIVPRKVYGDTVLKNGDTVEVVRFVGGG